MSVRSRRWRCGEFVHLSGEKLLEYYRNHVIRRIKERHKLTLSPDDLQEIVRLIHIGRNEYVKLASGGKKNGGRRIYLVIFKNRVLPTVYDPQKNCLVTCLRLKWVFRLLSKERREEIKAWLRERRQNLRALRLDGAR